MKTISSEKVDTTNAWGFGGWVGTSTKYDNGVTFDKGKYYYRHAKPSLYHKWWIEVTESFSAEVHGTKTNTIALYKSDDEYYRAKFTDENPPEKYIIEFGIEVKLVKVISLI